MTNNPGVSITYKQDTWKKALGRFRNATHEYYWELVNGTSGTCRDGTIYIESDPHTVDTLPNNIDFDTAKTLSPSATYHYGIVEGPAIGFLGTYCIWEDV